jgi:hypothetical protein
MRIFHNNKSNKKIIALKKKMKINFEKYKTIHYNFNHQNQK